MNTLSSSLSALQGGESLRGFLPEGHPDESTEDPLKSPFVDEDRESAHNGLRWNSDHHVPKVDDYEAKLKV